MCVAPEGKRERGRKQAREPPGGGHTRIKGDDILIVAERGFVDETHAKATAQMMVCKDDGH